VTLALTGKGSWGDVVMDAVSLATFGIGRALMASGKLASVATRGRAWLHARTIVTGNSRARYRAVRTLLGGPLRQADDAIPLAGAGGLLRAGLRNTSPRTVVQEVVDEAQRARRVWTSPQAVLDDVRQAAVSFSGGKWGGVPGGLLNATTPELRALSAIDDAVLAAPGVAASANTANLLTRSTGLATFVGFGQDASNLLPSSPAVDPASPGVGSQPAGLPEGFQMPSSSIPPTPAVP
jgi:hypothetical protein